MSKEFLEKIKWKKKVYRACKKRLASWKEYRNIFSRSRGYAGMLQGMLQSIWKWRKRMGICIFSVVGKSPNWQMGWSTYIFSYETSLLLAQHAQNAVLLQTAKLSITFINPPVLSHSRLQSSKYWANTLKGVIYLIWCKFTYIFVFSSDA